MKLFILILALLITAVYLIRSKGIKGLFIFIAILVLGFLNYYIERINMQNNPIVVGLLLSPIVITLIIIYIRNKKNQGREDETRYKKKRKK